MYKTPENNQPTPEVKKPRKGLLIGLGAGASALLLAGGIAFGVNQNNGEQNNDGVPPSPDAGVSAPETPVVSDAPESEAPITSEPAEPTPIETVEPTPEVPVETESLIESAEYQKLMEMSQAAFDKLPQSKKLQVLDAQEADNAANQEDGILFGASGTIGVPDDSKLYKRNPRGGDKAVAAGPKDKAEDIAHQLLHDQQMIVIQFYHNGDDDYPGTGAENAEKMLSAMVVDTDSKAYSKMKTVFIDSIAPQDDAYYGLLSDAPKLTHFNTYEPTTVEAGPDGKNVPTMKLSFTAERTADNGTYLPAGGSSVFDYTVQNVAYKGIDGVKRTHWVTVEFGQTPTTAE